MNYNMQYDEQGRPYFEKPGGGRNYVSPAAMGETAPTDNTGIFRKAPQWNQNTGKWETPLDWGNIINIGVASGLGVGALDAAGVFGAAAPSGAAAPTASTSGATSGLLPSTTIGSEIGTVPGATSALTSGDVAGMFTPSTLGTGPVSNLVGAKTSWIDKILGKKPGIEAAGDAGKMFGSLENGEAENRWNKARYTQDYDKLMLDAQKERNLNESDAMKKLHQTGYILGGGSKYGQPVQLNSGTMPMFPNGPMAPTDAQKAGASTLEAQLGARLAPGGSYTPTKPDYLNRGKVETAGQIGNIAAGGWGLLKDIFGK